jgi:hypothetical protein
MFHSLIREPIAIIIPEAEPPLLDSVETKIIDFTLDFIAQGHEGFSRREPGVYPMDPRRK